MVDTSAAASAWPDDAQAHDLLVEALPHRLRAGPAFDALGCQRNSHARPYLDHRPAAGRNRRCRRPATITPACHARLGAPPHSANAAHLARPARPVGSVAGQGQPDPRIDQDGAGRAERTRRRHPDEVLRQSAGRLPSRSGAAPTQSRRACGAPVARHRAARRHRHQLPAERPADVRDHADTFQDRADAGADRDALGVRHQLCQISRTGASTGRSAASWTGSSIGIEGTCWSWRRSASTRE